MRILIIGGITGGKTKKAASNCEQTEVLAVTMRSLGARLAGCGHEIAICSPFPDSADYYVLQGVSEVAQEDKRHPSVSFYYPATLQVKAEVESLLAITPNVVVHKYPCKSLGTRKEDVQYGWLLAQLTALDMCAGVIAVGGRPSGTLDLLFHLADARNKRVLPLTFLGGAAQLYFDTKVWDLKDVIADDVTLLGDPSGIDRIPGVIETLMTGTNSSGLPTFFISYPRRRPTEADHVETFLRRRGHVVYRDDETFEPSAETQEEIVKNIQRSSVFIALWCVEYACSPWCNDELEIALARREMALTDLWILCIDDTRIVPKAARGLNYYRIKTRDELEGKLLALSNKLNRKDQQRNT